MLSYAGTKVRGVLTQRKLLKVYMFVSGHSSNTANYEPLGGLNAVPPFALLASIWVCGTGVQAIVDRKSSFLNVFVKLIQWENAPWYEPFTGYRAEAPY